MEMVGCVFDFISQPVTVMSLSVTMETVSLTALSVTIMTTVGTTVMRMDVVGPTRLFVFVCLFVCVFNLLVYMFCCVCSL